MPFPELDWETMRYNPVIEPDALPCPFCNGTRAHHAMVEELRDDAGGGWRVICYGCLIGTLNGAYKTRAEAISAWNRRAALSDDPDAKKATHG